MRNQDKGLLTTSTRLLNAQVKKAELKNEMEAESDMARTETKFGRRESTGPAAGSGIKAISTIDLLRK